MASEFTQRLQRAFDFASMAQIARSIGVPHATVRNYFQGRLPAPEVLIKIANETNVSLNWLLTGKGEPFLGVSPRLDLGRILEERINDIIDRKLSGESAEPSAPTAASEPSDDDFDVESATIRYDDPHKVMNLWFKHERRKYPQDYGIAFFQGWETYSDQEKIEAIRDAKKVLDRTLKKK